MLRGEAWQVIPEKNDKLVDDGQRTSLLHQAQQGIPLGPAVVGSLPPDVEWGGNDGKPATGRVCRGDNLGCIRFVGMRGFLIIRGVVPVGTSGIMGVSAHYREGAAPGGDRYV